MNDEQEKVQDSHVEDAQLVRAFKKSHDIASFDALVIKYKNRVFNICFRFLGEREEANDCAQETFLKVYRALSGFREEAAFSTWLYRIAMNTCKNRISSREYRRKRMTVNPGGSENGEDRGFEIEDTRNSPVLLFERSEKARIVREAIASLDARHRAVVILRDIEGFSYEEIARIEGLNVGTVKSRIARAREALKEKLKDVI
jgi:RNA polymerase sigma-70 factor (ECF subfamily)